jgi:hypothetical protein
MANVALIDVLILNRNLKQVTDNLVATLKSDPRVDFVGVIDAGSRQEEISNFTVVRDDSIEVEQHGLRLNRGFNLGVSWWQSQERTSNYLLLLPNDTEIINFELDSLVSGLAKISQLAAALPLMRNSPYTQILPKERVGIVWSVNEGPIILTKTFVEHQFRCGVSVFDNQNFRGYLSFTDLAVKIYANNFCIVASDLISFKENETYLQSQYQLIGTEPVEENSRLLLNEGKVWLAKKYGLHEGRSLELIARLLFEEFFRANPKHISFRIR